MKKKKFLRVASIVLAAIMPFSGAVIAFNATGETNGQSTFSTETKYESPDINSLTGHGEEPEELSVSAGATYQEKAWYEYVMYSDHAVSSYRLDDDSRLLFYDPYTYTNSMIMDVKFDASTTQFDTMSSYSISHTNSKTIQTCVSSTDTNTTATQTSGRDLTGTTVTNNGYTKTIFNHSTETTVAGTITNNNEYEYIQRDYKTTADTVKANAKAGFKGIEEVIEAGTEVGTTTTYNSAWYTNNVTNTTSYSDDYKTTTKYTDDSYDTVENHTGSSTEGWSELSARVTKTIGSSTSTSNTWSESEGTTVTKTYAATHFTSDGITPLPWAIVHYQVQMPMKCSLQVKYSGEWVTLSTVYCLLTTVQGTCRAWMQNGQTYYEDWGNGEPVVATDFWSQFTTKENLIKAYNEKLYPVGGED